MLAFGVAVVVNRNPVASALSLVVSFLGLAALFMSLDAYFIASFNLVYAGAVMVLFLFIIMLLDLRAKSCAKSTGASAGELPLRSPWPCRFFTWSGIFARPASPFRTGKIDDRRCAQCRIALVRELNLPFKSWVSRFVATHALSC